MIYGYTRISTAKQSLQRQRENILRQYPGAELVEEVFTGTTADRPAWVKLKKKLEPGDMVVFDSVSRMSRSEAEGMAEYEELFSRGIELAFLKEPGINTAVFRDALSRQIAIQTQGNTAADRLVDAITAALNAFLIDLAKEQVKKAFEQSAKEVSDLHQRTKEGMKASHAGEKISASRTGKKYDTKKAQKAREVIKTHCRSFGGSLSDAECIVLSGLSRAQYYRLKAEIKGD